MGARILLEPRGMIRARTGVREGVTMTLPPQALDLDTNPQRRTFKPKGLVTRPNVDYGDDIPQKRQLESQERTTTFVSAGFPTSEVEHGRSTSHLEL